MPASAQERLERVLKLVDARLGAVPYLAGQELTAADIMSVFSLTTMRLFQPFDLAPYPNIRAYLQRIGGGRRIARDGEGRSRTWCRCSSERRPHFAADTSTLIDENHAARLAMSASLSGLAMSVMISCLRVPPR